MTKGVGGRFYGSVQETVVRKEFDSGLADLFYTATKEIWWILLTMTIKLMLSRLLIRLLGTSMTFWTLTLLILTTGE